MKDRVPYFGLADARVKMRALDPHRNIEKLDEMRDRRAPYFWKVERIKDEIERRGLDPVRFGFPKEIKPDYDQLGPDQHPDSQYQDWLDNGPIP